MNRKYFVQNSKKKLLQQNNVVLVCVVQIENEKAIRIQKKKIGLDVAFPPFGALYEVAQIFALMSVCYTLLYDFFFF